MSQVYNNGVNYLQQVQQMIDEANLKIRLGQLESELKSAPDENAQQKIIAQMNSLAGNSGQSLSNLGFNTNAGSNNNLVLNPNYDPASIFQNGANIGGIQVTSDTSKLGTEKDKSIIGDLNDEFKIRKGGGNRKDWEEYMKTAEGRKKVKIYDKKTGKQIDVDTAEKIASGQKGAGMIKGGYIMEVQSAKQGVVRIQVGGDGEINGRDDKVLSIGGQAATQAATTGLNNINNNMAAAAPKASGVQNATALTSLPALQNSTNNQSAYSSNPQSTYNLSQQEIRNLIAAILQSVNKN